MRKPAARQTDMTVHGGNIILGCPNVLIGGLMAARVGDMHVCPMQTPAPAPIPHVGGPISMSSAPTVLIGGMPAACVGDMLVCTGPPDTIAPPGCPTVLIGSGGGGGAGVPKMGIGGGGSASGQPGGGSDAEGEEETSEGHYLDVRFLDKGGFHVDALTYTLTRPDGSTASGPLTGRVREDNVEPGNHEIVLKGIIDAQWSVKAAKVGDEVTLKAKTIGIDPGTAATFEIYVKDTNFADVHLTTVEASVDGDAIEYNWTLAVDEDLIRISDAKEKQGGYSFPYFYFIVAADNMVQRSGLMTYADKIELTLRDHERKPLADRPYKLRLATGEIREGTTDGNGQAKEDGIPPGGARLTYQVRQ